MRRIVAEIGTALKNEFDDKCHAERKTQKEVLIMLVDLWVKGKIKCAK